MHDDCDLCDYKIENGYTIILMQRQPLAPINDDENGSSKAGPSEPAKKEELKKENVKKEEVVAKSSKEGIEEVKDERELTEEERKQKIKDELGEDVLKMLEGPESQAEG